MKRLWPLVAVFWPCTVNALTISPEPVVYEHYGPSFYGTIHLVSIGSGAEVLSAGGIDLIGSTAPDSIVAAFTVDHFQWSLRSIEVEAEIHLPLAFGWIPGPDEDLGWTFGAFTFPGDPNGQLDGGRSTDVFYVAYPGLSLGEGLRFTLRPWYDPEPVPNWPVNEYATAVAHVVPEPGTAALIGLGIGGILMRRKALKVTREVALPIPPPPA